MRRFVLLTLLCIFAGAAYGWIRAASSPPTLRSTARLLIKQQTSEEDGVQENIEFDILLSVLFSDKVLGSAFEQPQMQPFHDQFSNDPSSFIKQAMSSLTFEREVVSEDNSSIVALLHYDSDNGELSKASVQSFAIALQKWANSQQKESRGDLIHLISAALETIHPKIAEQERRYADFRRDAPLAWNSDGKPINPHRERQLFLTQRRSELYEELRKAQILLTKVETLADRAKSPETALSIISQLLDLPVQPLVVPNPQKPSIGKQWTEAIAERNRIAEELGEENSVVTELDTRIELFEAELKKIAKNQIDQAFAGAQKNAAAAKAAAERVSDRDEKTVAAIIYAKKAEVDLLTRQVENVDGQIAKEKAGSAKLAKYEQEDVALRRDIARYRALLDQLEEQMARVKLTTESEQMTIDALTEPTDAYVTGLRTLPTTGIGAVMGLGVGVVLSMLLGLILPAKRATL